MTKSATSTQISPFPERQMRKGILRQIVQLLKRHRDIAFSTVEADVAPISIITTTLAAKSYEYCVSSFEFDNELDVVIATIKLMPISIERPIVSGQKIYLVANETTSGENFADSWKSEPDRAIAFFNWHGKVLADYEALSSLEEIDLPTDSLSRSLGNKVMAKVMMPRTESISAARSAGKLYVAPAVGLALSPTSAFAAPVLKNTNFGD
jgi:hypothetical protein